LCCNAAKINEFTILYFNDFVFDKIVNFHLIYSPLKNQIVNRFIEIEFLALPLRYQSRPQPAWVFIEIKKIIEEISSWL